jgi:hypothetical protein
MTLLELDQECFDIHCKDGQVLLTWAIEKERKDVVSRLLEMRDVQSSEMLFSLETRLLL